MTFTSFTNLTRHKAEHIVTSNLSLFPIGNSTRNSFTSHEDLLCEDVTVDDIPLVTCDEAPEKEVVLNNIDNDIVKSSFLEQVPKISERNKCADCSKTFDNEFTLQVHNDKEHKVNTLYQCIICEFESTSSKILSDHIQTKHTEKEHNIHKCNKCEKEFQYYFLLENHICFKCDSCNFIGNTSSSL